MYKLTVKIASHGTTYVNQPPREPGSHSSLTGHMWYSLSDGSSTNDFGFAPETAGESWGPGDIYETDSIAFQSTYYTGSIVISDQQYSDLFSFGENPTALVYGFDLYYTGGANDCINFVWKALEIGGFNPGASDGSIWPSWNADEVDKTLYTALLGSTVGWNESLPDGGNYNAVYGSAEADDLTVNTNLSRTNTSVYAGGGDDTINLNPQALFYPEQGLIFVDGGEGNDTIIGTQYDDNLDLTNAEIKRIEQVDMGDGDDTVKVSTSADGPEVYKGGAGNDTIDGRMADRDLELYGGAGEDILFGGNFDDHLYGGAGGDNLHGGSDGSDTVSYKNSPVEDAITGEGVIVNLTNGAASGADAAGDTLDSIENLTGSAFNDRLQGDSNDNILKGMEGDDIILSPGGNEGFMFFLLRRRFSASRWALRPFSVCLYRYWARLRDARCAMNRHLPQQ